METEALDICNLYKSFPGASAVNGLNITIPQGQFYGLLGPNGAGKTTILRMVAGLLEPDSGVVRVLGCDLGAEARAAKQQLAYLPEEPPLYDKLNSMEYLSFVAGLWGIGASEAQCRAETLLRRLRLWDKWGTRAENLSRGMRQKLALAGALIHEPRLIILDEPLTGLDASAARLVKDILREHVGTGGTVILTTHLLDVAERMTGRLGIIVRGRLVAEGTLESLQERAGQEGSLEDVFLNLVEAAA